jgi:predicted HD phosphohydrolase
LCIIVRGFGVLSDIVAQCGAGSCLGEPATIGQHMLQAAHLAEAQVAGEDLVAAALCRQPPRR